MATSPTAVDTAGPAGPSHSSEPAPSGLRRLLPPALMLLVVGVAAGVPLLRNTIFYYWDDSAAAATPVWRRMGEAAMEGRFPLLELDMWRGGNFAAEAATGMWNPIVLGLAVATHPIDNMALAMTIIKTIFMLIMALGSYLLCREYGVRPGLSAAAGAALPLAGYSFFMDGTSWVNALMLTALIPWVWLTARRMLHRGSSVLWLVLAGYLTCSLGNPYALLATAFIVFAVLVEAWLHGRRGTAIRLGLAGLAFVLLTVMVYLPLLMTTSVGVRAGSRTENNEFFSPNLSNLLGISTPTGQPYVQSFGHRFQVYPATYLAWFVLPLVPWMKWRILRPRWRELSGAAVFGVISLLVVLGPSNLWMFRWPLRLIDFLWFPVMLLWVIVANEGLERSRPRPRYVATGALIALGAYLAWADLPQHIIRIGVGTVVVSVLVALLLRTGVLTRAGTAVMLIGTFLVLALQVHYYPRHIGVADYRFPTSQELLTERFDKYDGLTIQIADIYHLRDQDRVPDVAYRDLLFGTLYSTAGVESTTGYTGIGFTKLDNLLCMVYQGSTVCQPPLGSGRPVFSPWDRLWEPPPGAEDDTPLVDLLRAQTVVVQNALEETRAEDPPPGWRRDPEAADTRLVTVYKRLEPLPFPEGRVSHVTEGVRVLGDQVYDEVDERVRFTAADGGVVTFARLAWPGYVATVDGRPATVRTGPAGLVQVELPAGVTEGELVLEWHVPGKSVSIVAFALGLLLAAGLAVAPWLARRRRSPGSSAATPDAVPAAAGTAGTAPMDDDGKADRQGVPVGTAGEHPSG
ncbi:MAG TPA: hypothetical protein VGD67_28790 [Pseudonocardiaceae bacterium]